MLTYLELHLTSEGNTSYTVRHTTDFQSSQSFLVTVLLPKPMSCSRHCSCQDHGCVSCQCWSIQGLSFTDCLVECVILLLALHSHFYCHRILSSSCSSWAITGHTAQINEATRCAMLQGCVKLIRFENWGEWYASYDMIASVSAFLNLLYGRQLSPAMDQLARSSIFPTVNPAHVTRIVDLPNGKGSMAGTPGSVL